MLLGFSAGEAAYAIAVDYISEVLPSLVVEPPNAPFPGMLGFFNLRGERLPLFDLRLGTQDTPAKEALSTRIVVLDWDGHRVGLLVEDVLELFELDANGVLSGRDIVTPADIIPEEIYKACAL